MGRAGAGPQLVDSCLGRRETKTQEEGIGWEGIRRGRDSKGKRGGGNQRGKRGTAGSVDSMALWIVLEEGDLSKWHGQLESLGHFLGISRERILQREE